MYSKVKQDFAGILKKLSATKGIQLIQGKICRDHVHMYIDKPAKYCVTGITDAKTNPKLKWGW